MASNEILSLFCISIAAQLNVKLKTQSKAAITTKAGKVTVQGSNANVSHTINEDERREFTNHINYVSCLYTTIRLSTFLT
jgi:hypothetical protein